MTQLSFPITYFFPLKTQLDFNLSIFVLVCLAEFFRVTELCFILTYPNLFGYICGDSWVEFKYEDNRSFVRTSNLQSSVYELLMRRMNTSLELVVVKTLVVNTVKGFWFPFLFNKLNVKYFQLVLLTRIIFVMKNHIWKKYAKNLY